MPLSLQRSPRHRSRGFSIFKRNLAVHQNVLHAFGQLCRFGVSGFVEDVAGIKDGDVGEEAFFDQAAADQMFTLCGQEVILRMACSSGSSCRSRT